jgi:hypothetical protein
VAWLLAVGECDVAVCVAGAAARTARCRAAWCAECTEECRMEVLECEAVAGLAACATPAGEVAAGVLDEGEDVDPGRRSAANHTSANSATTARAI